MPALDPGTEATLPGSNRRRVWAHPDVKSHSVVVLTHERLHLAPLAGPPKPDLLVAAAYDDLDEVLGPLAIVVDLAAVRRVRLHLPTNTLFVEYVKDGIRTSRASVTFESAEVADAVFTKLWRRLGDGFKAANGRRDFWALARGPLGLLFGALLATAALVILLSVFEDFASARAAVRNAPPPPDQLGVSTNIPKTPIEGLLGWMDWRWICGLGGCAAAASQVWLYRRLTNPTTVLELKRA
jgi:hypothetical protein